MQNKLTFLLLLIVIVSGCTNQTNSIEENTQRNSATISIASPQEGQIFYKNDTVKFSGTILSKESIHGFTVSFLRKNSSDTLFVYKNQSHNTTTQINTFWVNTVSQLTNAEAIIVVELDHDGNTSVKKISCICNP